MMKYLYPIVIGLIILNAYSNGQQENKVRVLYQWNILEYSFPDNETRQQAIDDGELKPSNGMPIDVQPHYYDENKFRTFVTIPRFQAGTPYSLATISEQSGVDGPILQPYPNYEIHNRGGDNCDGITSAFRVAITECNQMWVIDSGTNSPCAPQLLLFDLNTDQLIHRYRFNSSLYTPRASTFVTPVVVVKDPAPSGSCQKTMVYVGDVSNRGLVVYDYSKNDAWRVEHDSLSPDSTYGSHTIAGQDFLQMDGVIGMTADKDRLYYHPMASITEYGVRLKEINKSGNFFNNTAADPEIFKALGKRDSECAATAIDGSRNVYCVTFNPIELISWNTKTSYATKNFKRIPINTEEFQFVSGMKVVKNPQGNEELWMFSNNYQKMASGTQNFNEVNFRVLVLSLSDIS